MADFRPFDEDIRTRFEKIATYDYYVVDDKGDFYAWDTLSMYDIRGCHFCRGWEHAKKYRSLESARKARCKVYRRCHRKTGIVVHDGFTFEPIVPVEVPKLRARRNPHHTGRGYTFPDW